MGLAFHAEDVIHDVVVSMIADENCLAKFEHLTEPEAKAYFMACLTHRMIDIIRREKRHWEYLETEECYEKKQKTESCSAETIVVEQLDFENNVAGTLRLLSTEERELLQKLPYREIAKRSWLRESAIAMRVMRLRKKILKICLKRGILCERPEKNASWA